MPTLSHDLSQGSQRPVTRSWNYFPSYIKGKEITQKLSILLVRPEPGFKSNVLTSDSKSFAPSPCSLRVQGL